MISLISLTENRKGCSEHVTLGTEKAFNIYGPSPLSHVMYLFFSPGGRYFLKSYEVPTSGVWFNDFGPGVPSREGCPYDPLDPKLPGAWSSRSCYYELFMSRQFLAQTSVEFN